MDDKTPDEAIDMDDLELDERCQVRVELNQEAVDHYAELLKDDFKFDPVEAFKVDEKLYLVDGWHRVAAARKADHKFIRCVVVGSGTMDEATREALSKNLDHGVRRTSQDKRRAVKMAIELGWLEQPGKNREVAKDLGVSETLVRNILKEVQPDKTDTEAGANKRSKATDASDQEEPPAVTDNPQAVEVPDTSTAEPSALERAQALAEIADIAAQLHGVVKKASAVIKDMSASEFPEIEELANDVLEAAQVLAAAAAAARKDEEGELRKAG